MNKTLLIIGAIALTGGAVYFFMRRNGGVPVIGGPTQMQTPVDPALLTQPSQAYPVTGPQPTRQDYVSQPWSATRPLVDASSDLAKSASDLKSISDVVGSVKSIWEDLDVSSWWSSTDTPIQEDSMPGLNWNFSYL